MNERTPLLIFGGSARAAAFSALRAGFEPWCADFFADNDLALRCRVQPVTGRDYPYGLLRVIKQAPSAAWLYTGALENRPGLVRRLSRKRSLWGCDAHALALCRAPMRWTRALQEADLPCPEICLHAEDATSGRSWLAKPFKSRGGYRVRAWKEGGTHGKEFFLQERIDGEPCSSVYLGDGARAMLLGSSRQLIGQDWLHAGAFRYCGSIGPLELTPAALEMLERMGNVLAKRCRLRGIFGVDFMLRDDVPWPIEINPRYTASVEVLEHAFGTSFLALHRRVFEEDKPGLDEGMVKGAPRRFVGKAILFARDNLVVPDEGPWTASLRETRPVEELPEFADIPRAGDMVAAGYPVMTCFAEGKSPTEVEARLREKAADLDERLTTSAVKAR